MASPSYSSPSTLPALGASIDSAPLANRLSGLNTFLSDAGNLDESNVDLTSADGLMGLSAVQNVKGLKSFENIAVAGGGVQDVIRFGLDPVSGTQANNDGVRLIFYADDNDGGEEAEQDMAYIDMVVTNVAVGAEVARFDFYVADTSGSPVSQIQITDGAIVPTTTDNISLGTSALNFSDLFLDLGAVINFNSGDVTITHSANTITVAGGTITGTLAAGAQGNVTGLGTLTALQVDYINANASTLTVTDSSDTGDKLEIAVGTHGATTITTTDDDAAAANLTITADGTVDIDSAGVLTLDSGAAINIEPASGSAILLDGTISIDGGAVTGVVSIAASGEISAASLDISGSVDIDGTMEADAITLDGVAIGTIYSVIAGSSSIVTVGTIGTGTWNADVIASAKLDADTAHLGITQTFTGAKTFTNTVTVGVDDAGHDVKFFGNAAGAYMEWDTSADQLRIMGASADATTSTGKLLLATSLDDINANDVLGKIDFQAPHEGGGDSTAIAASIQAVAQGTFASDLNATDLIFYTGHSEAATEKFRMTSQGEIGIVGANYGNDGDVLTSAGANNPVAWESPGTGAITQLNSATENELVTVGATVTQLDAEANLTFSGSNLAVLGTAGIGIARTEGTLHVHTATAGSTTANTSYDDLVVENSAAAGITILTPNTTTGTLAFGDDDNDRGYIQYSHAAHDSIVANTMAIRANGGSDIYLYGTAPTLGINETANAGMGTGITINQHSHDTEILAFKSTGDVDHGMSSLTEVDTFGLIKKINGDLGGLEIQGYADSGLSAAMLIKGIQSAAETGKTTGANAGVMLRATVKNSTSEAALGTNENICVMQTGTTTRFIYDAEGSGHADVEFTTFDTYDDIALIGDIEAELVARESDAQTDRRLRLVETGIIGKGSFHVENGKTRAMVNFTKLAMLHHGAHIQTGERLNFYEQRMVELESRNALLEQRLNLLEN